MNHDKLKVVSQYVYSPSDILGTGTWGSVFRTRHKQKAGEFALKKMNKFKVEASNKSFQKYQSQVIALQKASEIKEVIRIVDFFKSKSNYYIVTEYFPGSLDLYDFMLKNKEKFCEEQARQIWLDLLTGIKELHSMGIYHRDLKLQNVVYLPDQRKAKIIDFGMATCFPNPEGMVGSPMFMSPQVLGCQKYTRKCDIWSLGIIFYCMIFRLSPYGDTTNPKLILQKMKEIEHEGISFPFERFATEECKQVIRACLHYEEQNRMEIDQILELKFFSKVQLPENVLDYYEPTTTFKP